PLWQKARRLDRRQCPELLKDRDAGRQQRFAHMVTREPLPFEQAYVPAFAREHRRGGGSAGAATNDDHIGLSHGTPSPLRPHRRLACPTPLPSGRAGKAGHTLVASTGLFVFTSISNGLLRSSDLPISRTAGMTSSPISRRLRMASSWFMAPSPSQKKMLPGRRYSSTCRIFGITVLGVPVMMLILSIWSSNVPR